MTTCIAGDPWSRIFEVLNLFEDDPINFDFEYQLCDSVMNMHSVLCVYFHSVIFTMEDLIY